VTTFATFPIVFASLGWLVVSVVIHFVVIGIPVLLLAAAAFYLLSLPLRRSENARLFLHLVETNLRDGRQLEPALISMANSKDRTLGLRFHLMAAHLEEGDRLGLALRKSQLLPRPLAAMFAAGEELGDLRPVLPACRLHLGDTTSGQQGALNYFFVLVAGLAPVVAFLSFFVRVIIAPKMKEIFYGMHGIDSEAGWLNLLQASLQWTVWVQTAMLGLLLCLALLYLSGPGLPGWLRALTHPVTDRVAWLVPWKRKRMQRNFAAMLATLLDHGVPEAAALRLAASCTGNDLFVRRAELAVARLAGGETLTEAVAALDDAGEFRWRLRNASAGRAGFGPALRGWFESLDARAYQQEQAAAQLITTALVVVNGVCVGCICAGMFGALVSLIELSAL
jgi:type II secretory pathway component PulF